MTKLVELVADVQKCQLWAMCMDTEMESPLKIILIKDIKSPPSLVPCFASPFNIS